MKVKECRIDSDGNDIFVIADGVKIAKRGHPGTSQDAFIVRPHAGAAALFWK